MTDIGRLLERVVKDPETGCWEWQGSLTLDGYGRLRWKGATRRAHRLAYELLREPIPDGLTIDHLCRNRGCINPSHMEPVTQAVNTHRGFGPTALNARKTECCHGHPFNEENTYINPKSGGRACRTCRAEREQRRDRSDYWKLYYWRAEAVGDDHA